MVDPLQEKIHSIKGLLNNNPNVSSTGNLTQRNNNANYASYQNYQRKEHAAQGFHSNHQNNKSLEPMDLFPITNRESIQDKLSKKRGNQVNQANIQINSKQRIQSGSYNPDNMATLVSKPGLNNFSPVRQNNPMIQGPLTHQAPSSRKNLRQIQQSYGLNQSMIYENALSATNRALKEKEQKPVAQSLDTHQLLLARTKKDNQQPMTLRDQKQAALQKNYLPVNKLAELSKEAINLN